MNNQTGIKTLKIPSSSYKTTTTSFKSFWTKTKTSSVTPINVDNPFKEGLRQLISNVHALTRIEDNLEAIDLALQIPDISNNDQGLLIFARRISMMHRNFIIHQIQYF
jgi:hypothetical protein